MICAKRYMWFDSGGDCYRLNGSQTHCLSISQLNVAACYPSKGPNPKHMSNLRETVDDSMKQDTWCVRGSVVRFRGRVGLG